VVSGHVRGKTNTLPLHVEILYNEYNFQAAFAVASLLAVLALVTLVAKSFVEWRTGPGARSIEQLTASGAGFTPAERAGGLGGATTAPLDTGSERRAQVDSLHRSARGVWGARLQRPPVQ
jgi:hypothetical protein